MGQPTTDNQMRVVGMRAERALLVIAALCVVMMPSVYRGGSSVPHSHGFLQFWITGPERAFDHHQDEGDHDHGHHDHASTTPASSEMTATSAADEPTVSPATAPGGAISEIVMALSTLLGLAVLIWVRWSYTVWQQVLIGRDPTPEPPPPRYTLARA